MNRPSAFVMFTLLAAAPAAPQQSEWKDLSPHAATLVTVEDGVQLEVLDWRGSGPAIVLLAGLGDTAHVFDDFAPLLTTRYRVLGVTRRGHGRSSAPATGYVSARLASDVMRVVETMGVKRPVIAGHSFAGEELHVLGASYSAQIAGLVYIDAAFNRADGSEDYDAVAKTLPDAPRPEAADLASFSKGRSDPPGQRHIFGLVILPTPTEPWLAHGHRTSRSVKRFQLRRGRWRRSTTLIGFAYPHSRSTPCRNRLPT
jgi:pimeloyl-ACP methyl ester carboxylesterase